MKLVCRPVLFGRFKGGHGGAVEPAKQIDEMCRALVGRKKMIGIFHHEPRRRDGRAQEHERRQQDDGQFVAEAVAGCSSLPFIDGGWIFHLFIQRKNVNRPQR